MSGLYRPLGEQMSSDHRGPLIFLLLLLAACVGGESESATLVSEGGLR